MLTEQAQGIEGAEVVDIGIGGAVDGLAAEEAQQALMAHAEQAGQFVAVEIRVPIGTILFHAQFDEGHQLSVILQVGIALPVDVFRQDFAGHLHPSAQFRVLFQSLCQVEVAADESDDLILEPFHLTAKGSIVIDQLLDFFLAHFQGYSVKSGNNGTKGFFPS